MDGKVTQVSSKGDYGKHLRIENEDIITLYAHCSKIFVKEGDNILDDWFRSCVRTKKQTDMGILHAYMNMKSKLEQEYKQLKTYMDFYDFSKCKPIPSVSMDKKMRENYYKTLHIEPECVILNKINNKNIEKISTIKPMVKFNLLTSKGMLLEGKKDLYSYQNHLR